MHSFLKKIIISLALVALLPIGAIAYEADPELGIVNINVQNHLSEEISGIWYLHRYNISGPIVRNGMKSYDFQTDEGYYFFEARKVDKYKAFKITSDETIFLNKGESITFNVTYYPDQEYMDAFLAGEIVEDPEPVEEEPEPEPVEEPVEEPEEEEEEDLSGPITVTIISPTSDPIITPAVPDFTTAPTAPAEDDSEMDFGAIPVLATTGPATLLLLFPSIAAGLYAVTRRKKQ